MINWDGECQKALCKLQTIIWILIIILLLADISTILLHTYTQNPQQKTATWPSG